MWKFILSQPFRVRWPVLDFLVLFSRKIERWKKEKRDPERKKKTLGPSFVHLSRADLIWTSLGVTGAKIAQRSH